MADEEDERIDLGDPDSVSKRTRDLKLKKREDDADLLWIMQAAPGRRWMWRFLESLHVFHTPFGKDPYMSYFAGGEKNVGLMLLAELMRACPEYYWTMVKENQSD